MTTAAMCHFGPEFGREHTLLLIVSITRVEEGNELPGSVAPIHVEGEQAAVFAAGFASKALELALFMVPGRDS